MDKRFVFWAALTVSTIAQASQTVQGELTIDGSTYPGVYLSSDGGALGAVRADLAASMMDIGDLYSRAPAMGIRFFTSDLERVRITPGGAVGIGTTSPEFNLDVAGSIRFGGFGVADSSEWPKVVWLRDTNAGWDEGLIKLSSAYGAFGRAGFGVHLHQQRHFGFYSTGLDTLLDIEGGSGRVYIKGALGVGMPNPQYKLDVGGSTRLGGFSTSEAEEWPNLVWLRDLGTNWDEGLIKGGSSRSVFGRAGFGIHFHQARHFGFYSTGWDLLADIEGASGRMYIKGNVGIGTGSPASKLTVAGGDIAFDYGRGIVVSPQISWPSGTNRLLMVNWDGAIGRDVVDLYTPGAANPTSVLRLVSNGNVGIGTSNPTHRLSVNGTVRAREVVVESTGWADYVFAENYKLSPLSDVEQHIKTHKHLPGIPSAEQVAQQGVNVGEMQAKLLAKIEELTLHVIAQEKRLDDQASVIKEQAEQIRKLASQR